MLSQKFRRLCSHVIAILSSFGVYSVASAEDPVSGKTYNKDTNFTWSYQDNIEFNANYSEVDADTNCIYSTTNNKNIKSAVYSVSGTSGVCTYTCKDGAYFIIDDKRVSSVTGILQGTGTFTLDTSSGFCVFYPSSCNTATNATKSGPTYNSSTKTYECKWTCNDGYSVGGGSNTQTTQTQTATSSAALSIPKACAGKTYTATFDCLEYGYIKGTTEKTATKTATFGSSFTIDKECVSRYPNKEFSSWTAS